ncbi:T9SS type A sorting domain-containing protein [bacterium]|nr:T9SS type A sorting domain-containing protein [bacterium]
MGKTLNIQFLFLLVFIPAICLGQTNNFEFIQYDTEYVGSDEFVVLHGDIFSLIDVDQSITVTRVTHSIPATWSSSFCVGPACLPPFLDIFTFNFEAGDTALFTLDTYPYGEEGVGFWTMFAVDSSTMEVDSVQITMEFVTVAIDEDANTPISFDLSAIYPNPSNAWINFDLNIENAGSYSVNLYALDGRKIASREYSLRSGKNQLQWGMMGLPSGNYIISAKGEGRTLSRQVSIIK